MPETPPEPFLEALGVVGPAVLRALAGFEHAGRHLHPPRIEALREVLGPLRNELGEGRRVLADVSIPDVSIPEGLSEFRVHLDAAAAHAERALTLFCDASASEGIARILGAMREHCRALEALYPLRNALPPVARFFLEPAFHERLEQLDPEPDSDDPNRLRVGLLHAHNEPDDRGGFTLYVPESCTTGEPRPLIVALHGGSGHGADFVWTWLREAKSRRCLLLAPTARGPTWSLNGPDRDAKPLASMVEFVAERWPVDRDHVLLTGLSDGATYTLLAGLGADMPFTALAPVSGVLHPVNAANGNLERARDVPIYLVHGALDWMFPVALARMASEELRKAGARVEFREIDDLSHTYPREENARILEWLDPALASAD